MTELLRRCNSAGMRHGHYTTVCKDKYGRYYDLRYEHPSWEEKRKGIVVCIVRDAFTCTLEEADRLTGRARAGKVQS